MRETILTPLTIEFHGLKLVEPAILLVPMMVSVIYFSITSFVWLYQDAEQRGKKGYIALILILLTGWPISFLWWFWLRPRGERHQINWKLLQSSHNRRNDSGRKLVFVQARVTSRRWNPSENSYSTLTATAQKPFIKCQSLLQPIGKANDQN